LKGDDGVEGDGGADVDEREKAGNYAGHEDGIAGNSRIAGLEFPR
jgi:hypothetical protein